MFVFILKMFIEILNAFKKESFGESLGSNSKGWIKYVSLNNRPRQARLTNINSNERLFLSIYW